MSLVRGPCSKVPHIVPKEEVVQDSVPQITDEPDWVTAMLQVYCVVPTQ